MEGLLLALLEVVELLLHRRRHVCDATCCRLNRLGSGTERLRRDRRRWWRCLTSTMPSLDRVDLPICSPRSSRCWPSCPDDPRRRGLALRAEVGRVPLHRLPRRRRRRAGQPQRAAADPLLPRAARAAAASVARALRGRRRDRVAPPAATGSTSTRCCSASTRPSRGSTGWPRRPRRRSSPSTCSPSATASLLDRAVRGRVGPDSRGAGRARIARCTSRPPARPTRRRPTTGSAASRAPASTA